MHIYVPLFVAIIKLASGTCQAQSEDKRWSNPVLIYGSDLGNIFQQLYLTGNHQQMLELTARESREIHGDIHILDYYKQMQFAYPLELISHSRNNTNFQLIYKTQINATVHKIIMNVVVINDTVRVVLPVKLHESKYFLFGY